MVTNLGLATRALLLLMRRRLRQLAAHRGDRVREGHVREVETNQL